MFEEHQQGPIPLSFTPPAIALACGAGGLLLSFGLCGLGTAVGHNAASSLADLGIGVFFLSIFTMIISVPWFIVIAIINAVRGRG